MTTTVGQILVNDALPPELRDYARTLGKDETDDILGEIARTRPDEYRDICKRLVDLGRNGAFDEGATITLGDLVPVVDKKPMLDLVRRQSAAIRASRRLSESEKDDAIAELYDMATKRLTDETYTNALAVSNPFALQAKFKARGNKNQLGAMLTSPGTYTDSEGNIVPIFIGRSYAEGLRPHEYWAASYGARLGVTATKLATQKGGYLAKMLNSASIDQVVTEDDCGTENGIPVKSDDADSIGAVLQEAVGGFKPGTVITKSVLDKIRASGVDEFMVRSPITCACKDGLCKRCVGIRETGRFPDIGYNVGITAASALGEQIAQNSLNCIAEGTLVRMADMSVKPIERIEPGEYVLGCGLDGFLTPSRVVARYDNGIQPCVSTRFVANGCHKAGDGPILVSTRVHPILGTRFVSGQKDEVNNFKPRVLEVGMRSKHFYAYSPKGSRGNITAYRRVEQVDVGDRHVYDLEIDHPDHLYLLANGLVVHNSKHSGKRNDLGSYVGFDALKNLTTIPNTYDVKASVARRDGVVTSVEKAPQGGSYVILDGSTDPDDRIYVPASLEVTSKVGDRLEAGDAVSQGLVSPADVVAYKGIGEGRRYFTNRMRKVFQDSKYGVSRRNVEVLARSLINNVRVDRPDSEGPGLPGDILRYSAWVQGYSPREGASEASPDKSVGRYLERPVMHYTVGTRITPNVVASMKRHGVQRVLSNETAPGVSPHMVSVVEAPAYSGDWMARLGTSYLKDRLLEDAQNVSTSKTHSTNPIPALAKGVEFGDDIEHGIY